MTWHLLGYGTVLAQAVTAGFLIRYLWVTGTRPWTWQRPLTIPKPAGELRLSSGSDYVGVI